MYRTLDTNEQHNMIFIHCSFFLQIFVNRLREELNEIWKKCHCSEKEKSAFVYFNTDSYSEDLLVLHENEVKKWVSFYEENK